MVKLPETVAFPCLVPESEFFGKLKILVNVNETIL